MKPILFFTMTLASMIAMTSITACRPAARAPENPVFTGAPGEVRLLTLAPGHFHAALVQKVSYPQVNLDAFVYAPPGDEVEQHLKQIDGYNDRAENPTHWNEIVYLGEDYLERMIAEKRGNVMVVAGNNRRKTEYIKAALDNGIHVLADKPMAINPENFRLLEECFEVAREKGLLLYDIMTERFEITSMLQRELARIPELFGGFDPGTPDNPSIVKESVHHFSKQVSGVRLLRPAWFFDIEQEGDGIVDVTTHLVDLIQWGCFPEQVIEYGTDIEMLDANRWITPVDSAQFRQVTGLDYYPDYLRKDVKDGVLRVYANGDILYKLKGLHAKVIVRWNFEAPAGSGDTHYSLMRGTRAELIIRQGAQQNFTPSLYVRPVGDASGFDDRLSKAVDGLLAKYPGISVKDGGDGTREISIPGSYRVGHEAHFGEVTSRYLGYLVDGALPEWETPNMIAKYYVTTSALGIAMSK